ncbi:MAG: serine/threonine protein phosphatase [Spirochaetales bacterium]|nr:serine/threonine protein phosphatase [Spirochaetales bacterium]
MEFEFKKFFSDFIYELENRGKNKFIDQNIDIIKNAIFNLTNIYSNYPKWIFLSDYIESKKLENPEILAIGDIHADFYSLKKIIKIKLESPEIFLIFLGDYIDRGEFSNEVFILVILLNLIFPSTVFLLPGNHELYHYFQYQNPDFWIQDGKINLLFEPIKGLIESLPLILSFKNVLFIHGGFFDFDKNIIRDIDFVNLLKKEKGMKLKNLIEFYEDKVFDLAWADYADNYRDIIHSKALGRPVKSEEDLKKLKNNFGIDLIIRGHQPSLKGISFNKKVVTLITSFLYSNVGRMNGSLIALLKKKNNNFKNIETLKDNSFRKDIEIVENLIIEDYAINIARLL